MSKDGWIKGWRKTLDNPVVMKSPEHFLIWHYLLYNAEPKPKQALLGGEPITLNAGQLTTGRKQIAANSGISESRVERILTDLENAQQIEQQKTTKNRLISIVNWKDYQANEQPIGQRINNKRTTKGQQPDTLREDKNVKKEINTMGGSANDMQPPKKGTEEYLAWRNQ